MEKINTIQNIIWVEKLTLLKLFLLLFRALMSKTIIYYSVHNVNHLTYYFIEKINRVKKFFYSVELTITETDSDNEVTYYTFLDQLERISELISKKYVVKEENEGFRKILKNRISHLLKSSLQLLVYVENRTQDFSPQTTHTIIIDSFIMIELVNEYSNQIKIIQPLRSYLTNNYFSNLFFLLLSIVKNLFFTHKLRDNKTDICHPKPSIWVEYVDNEIVRPSIVTSFWKTNINLTKYDFIYYFDRNDTIVNKKKINKIRAKGYIKCFKWINLKRSLWQIVSISFRERWNICISSLAIALNLRLPVWYRLMYINYIIKLKLYTQIFSYYKVKILVQHQETSWRQEVQKQAIQASGGIMLGTHWSSYIFPDPFHIRPHHVYFVWGKLMYELIIKENNQPEYSLPSGLWITESIDTIDIDMTDKNFLLCIFDSSVDYNIHQTPRSLSKFWIRILNLLEKNPNWAGIIKSKNHDSFEEQTYLPDYEVIKTKAKKLIQNGQLLFINRFISPVTPSNYSNLTICYSLNSAGIISAVYDNKSIHWDPIGLDRHPFYKNPDQKIVYKDIDDFEDAIIKASCGDESIGDFSKWKHIVSYYDDDRQAARRVGGFINNYMLQVIKTKNSQESLKYAVNKYMKENNVDSSFYENSNIWS